MKDLYRCLEDQNPELVQAIAAAWHVALPEGDPRAQAQQLGDTMLHAGALERTLAELSTAGRAALDDLVRAGGALPAHRLAPAYGSIRRAGPARLAREQPWQQPANALEELYYRGLIDRAYATVGTYTGQVLLVPTQLFERLGPLVPPHSTLDVASADPPAVTHDDGNALIEDLFALLVTLRHSHVPAPAASAVGLGPRAWPRLDLSTRLQGEPHPLRLTLIAELAARLGLAREVDGWLRPGPRAREWLRISDARRQRSTFLAWREDARWNELAQLPSLRCDEQINPAVMRRALLEVLAECPDERWLSVASFVQAVKRRRPDYLRADGDYVTWRVNDAASGEHLTGPASWDRVEGVLAQHILTTSLRWLGLVATGSEAGGATPFAFRLTPQGRAILGRDLREHLPAGADTPRPLVTISDDLTITVALQDTLHERYQLERFAVWERQDTQAIYRVTADSLWQGYNAGAEVAQVVKFLTRVSGDHVPAPALRDLLAWGGHLGRVRLREMLLLQTDDERIMKQITSRAELRALLGTALSPTTCLVERGQANKLIQQLKALGIWPKLEG